MGLARRPRLTTVGEAAFWVLGLMASADDAHLEEPTVCSEQRHVTLNPSTTLRRSTRLVGR